MSEDFNSAQYIYRRRLAVKEALGDRERLTTAERDELMGRFRATHGSIYADIQWIKSRALIDPGTYDPKKAPPNQELKNKIALRDAGLCQYCGLRVNGLERVIEHVIPMSQGGISADHNLVVACRYCNHKKRDRVWIPHNIPVLMALNKPWAKKIIKFAAKGHQHLVHLNMTLEDYQASAEQRAREAFETHLLAVAQAEAERRGKVTAKALLKDLVKRL